MTSSSETFTDSKVLLSTRFVTVDTVPAVTSEGAAYEHTRVTSAFPSGAVVVPVYRDRGLLHVCLVRQYRPVLGTWSIEFPRGSTADLTEGGKPLVNWRRRRGWVARARGGCWGRCDLTRDC